tara:strand:- start:22 stop:483 length:462 start_codon:yes stop_codon:yes gene_type:complete
VYPTIVIGKPLKKADWEIPPRIRICPDVSIDPARVSKAMNYWEKLGYKFSDIVIEKDMYQCISQNYHGEIVFTLPNQEFNSQKYMAMTRITTRKSTNEIVRATIYITKKKSESPRVLEHELGHALGWQHYKQSRHIMNPDWRAGGYDSYGLRK